MKARTPKLNLPHCEGEYTDVKNFIYQECANYAEAAEFFLVSQKTIERWMSDGAKPHPSCIRSVELWKQLQLQKVS
jgi:hypothetical protein